MGRGLSASPVVTAVHGHQNPIEAGVVEGDVHLALRGSNLDGTILVEAEHLLGFAVLHLHPSVVLLVVDELMS